MKPRVGIIIKNLTKNPYLDEFKKAKVSHRFLTSPIRGELCSKYSWAIPDKEAIYALAKLSPILELGAGTGYWASLLDEVGAEVLAFDKYPPALSEGNHYHPQGKQWFPVQEGGPEVASKYPDHTLFLCWPPYADPFATEATKAFMAAGGKRLVYVGEGNYGCTGDDAFHELLRESWNQEKYVALPTWEGIHDGMMIYRRI